MDSDFFAMGIFAFYTIISVVFMIIGLIVMVTGFATDRKPLKLAGIVIAATALQVIVIFGILWALTIWN